MAYAGRATPAEVSMASLRTKLERLESLREKFGALVASEKLHLLMRAELEHKSLGRAADVIRVKGVSSSAK